MINRKGIILAFCVIVLLLNILTVKAIFCGYTCGATNCEEVCNVCPDPPGDCIVTCSCVGDCVAQDPALVYNAACGASFDWTKGDLNTVPVDIITQNMDKIGGRLSELDSARKQAVADALAQQYNLPPGSINLDACTGSQSCSITFDANGNAILSSGGVPLDVGSLKLSEGSSVQAISPAGWQFNIPPGGEITYGGITFRSTDGGTTTFDGEKATLSQGTSLTYTDPRTGTITTVFSKQGSTDVYFGTDLPAGKTGVAINGPTSNGDGVQIRGVIVAVAHTTPDGQTVGIITDRMNANEEVLLKKVPNQGGKVTYALDLTEAGYSNVKFTDGYEGLTYDAGMMYQCNQAVGSCPYDTKTDIKLLVTWYDTGQQGGTLMSITVQGHSGIIGANILVCPCDKTIPCDAGCVCDMICGLCDPIAKPQQSCLPEWMWITLGYEMYLKCTQPTSSIICTADSDCCQAYGAPYKPLAFQGRADICEVGSYTDVCGRTTTCTAENQRTCMKNPCQISITFGRYENLVSILYEFGFPIGTNFCTQHCGYCNNDPKPFKAELITNISKPIKTINPAQLISDEYPETVTFEIISQTDTTLTNCQIYGSVCNSNEGAQGIVCSIPQKLGSTTISIGFTDECGKTGTTQLKITVINVTNSTTAQLLGLYINDVNVQVYGGTSAQPPAVDLKINGQDGPVSIEYGSLATFSWVSQNADRCTMATIGHATTTTIDVPLSYSITTGPVNQSGTVTFTCTGAGGTAEDSVKVNVIGTNQQLPTADIKLNGQDGPVTIKAGSIGTFSWASTNANACTIHTRATDGTESQPFDAGTSGTVSVPVNSSGTVILTCTGPGGSAYDSVQVIVSASDVPPSASGIQYLGYYWSYAANPPYSLGDFMAETAPFANIMFIAVGNINTAVDSSTLAAVRRAKSLGFNVILDIRGGVWCDLGNGEWGLCPNLEANWNAYRANNQLDQIFNEGIFAFYFADEPRGPYAKKADQEKAIQTIHDTYPGSKVMTTYIHLAGLEEGVPTGLDYISFDNYNTRTKEEFDRWFVEKVEWLKANTNIPIILTVETFQGDFAPYPEQQSWYVELAAKEPQVIGMLYFLYTDRWCELTPNDCAWGARHFPDVIDYHKQVFNQYIVN